MGRRRDTEDEEHAPHGRLVERRVHAIYTKCTQQRREVMKNIIDIRHTNKRHFMKTLTKRVGPKWYQVFSMKQRAALDFTKSAIGRSLMSDNIEHTVKVLQQVGIYKMVNRKDLMVCTYMGRDDPKELYAQLFHYTYGHNYEIRMPEYDLNAKLLLTSIYYLALDDLLNRLKERFSPPTREPSPNLPKPKPKPKLFIKPKSPYLEKCIAPLWVKPKPKPFVQAPLPNLEELNESFEPTPVPTVVEVPPPPRAARSLTACDKMAGLLSATPDPSSPGSNSQRQKKRILTSRVSTQLNRRNTTTIAMPKRLCKKAKLVPPNADCKNQQYHISGIFCVKGRYVYVLGGIVQLPLVGELIHGGHRDMGGGLRLNIVQGVRGVSSAREAASCHCLQKYRNIAFNYVKSSKCRCTHYYDFGHEGPFPPEEAPYFTKPMKTSPYQFNYDTIYELNPKTIHINKEFDRVWKQDSMLTTEVRKSPIKKKRQGQGCLGEEPSAGRYLRCALRHLRRVNMAARLPDLQRAPELKEWMRYRLHGPLSPRQRATIVDKSIYQSEIFHRMLTLHKWGQMHTKKIPEYYNLSDWGQLSRLRKNFSVFAEKHRQKLFLKNAYITNLMWTAMYQNELPNRKFREIYFSYMVDGLDDFKLMRPYSVRDSLFRRINLDRNRMLCLPREVEFFKETM